MEDDKVKNHSSVCGQLLASPILMPSPVQCSPLVVGK